MKKPSKEEIEKIRDRSSARIKSYILNEYEEYEVDQLKILLRFMDQDGFNTLSNIDDIGAIDRRIEMIESTIDQSVLLWDAIPKMSELSENTISEAEKENALRTRDYCLRYAEKLEVIKKDFINKRELLVNKSEPQLDAEGNKLSLPQIALIYSYEDTEGIKKGDCAKSIALKYGYNSSNSGESLYQNYIKYKRTVDRKGEEETRKKTKNKLDKIKSVLSYLSENAIKKATDEINILEALLKKP